MMDVYIVGGNHHNALGVIRSLGEKGIKPNVIIQCEESIPYIGKSKYIHNSWIVKTDDEVIHILKQQGKLLTQKAVLIACSDNLSSLIDLHHNELNQWFLLPGSAEQGRITYLMDKEVMSDLAREVGFVVPPSVAVDIKTTKQINVTFPWIIKPLLSKNGQKSDIERIYSELEWKDYCKNHKIPVQVQQLIDKDYEYQLIGLSLKGGEEVIIPGLSHVIRPAATTNTGFLHYVPLTKTYDAIVEKGKQFLKATGYSGLFSLEFLRGKDGKDYFMEINFRNDGNAICVTASGVNLPYIWYLYQAGGDYKGEISKSSVNQVYVMPEFADVRLVIQRNLALITWLKDIHRTDRFMEFDKHDKIPFFYLFKDFCERGIKKLFHQ